MTAQDDPVPELGQPWDDPDAEYAVLTELLVPAAHGRYDQAMQAWNAAETKALGFLAIAAAIVAGLASVHDSLGNLWWLPASGCAVAGALFVGSLWPRIFPKGPDLLELHDAMRAASLLESARTMFGFVMRAAVSAEQIVSSKTRTYYLGLLLLSLSAAGSIPVIVRRA